MKESGRAPMGKIYHKYFNQLRILKNSGLLKKKSANSAENNETTKISLGITHTKINIYVDILLYFLK